MRIDFQREQELLYHLDHFGRGCDMWQPCPK
jgi:hypothetical protein